MAINDPKWSNGSIVLIQSVGDEPTVRWLVGSTVFDFEFVAAAEGGLSIPRPLSRPFSGPLGGI